MTVEFGYSFQFGSPDTGNVHITNTGTTDWVGMFKISGTGNVGYSFFDVFTGLLTPGSDIFLVAGAESSNQGGFNGPLGILFEASGTLGGIGLTDARYDGDVHSGFPRVSPCSGTTTDAFILQGGDLTGCDTGDDFEVSQEHARFDLTTTEAVPEVSAPTALMAGGVGLALFAQARRRKTA